MKSLLIGVVFSIGFSPILNACSLNLVVESERNGVKLSWSAPAANSSMVYEVFDKNGDQPSGWRFAGTTLIEAGKSGS